MVYISQGNKKGAEAPYRKLTVIKATYFRSRLDSHLPYMPLDAYTLRNDLQSIHVMHVGLCRV